ncbi:hypothetical protein IAT38_006438 [Cryptococcus sp. DSM 104549]
MFDPHAPAAKVRASFAQDFQAVILVGYGENLYPFNQGTNVVSKALLPVGNVPIINSVIDWVLAAGLLDILLIVPPSFHAQIADHIAEYYSKSTHPRVRINLRRNTEGERDDDEEDVDRGMPQRDGTARILKRFRGLIKSDFVLLPCDISPPSYLPLKNILDRHRSTPTAVLTSVFYEPLESVKENEEKLLVGLDKETNELLLIQPMEGLDEELEVRMALINSHPTLALTTRLLDAHVYVFRRTFLDLLSTRRSKDLDSMREQVVPWLIKGGWQKALGQRWAQYLDPPNRDPLAAALARSTTAPTSYSAHHETSTFSSPSSDHTPLPQTSPGSPSGTTIADSGVLPPHTSKNRKANWKCQVMVVTPPPAPTPVAPAQVKGGNKNDKSRAPPAAEPEHLIRANSLAGYWELNRRFTRSLSTAPALPGKPAVPPALSLRASIAMPNAEDAGAAPAISSLAQISPDTLIGEGTRVGEKASMKKCIVGRHCVIGKGAKLNGCVLWDFVTIEENARIENTIICSNSRIGEKAQVKDCEFGTGFEAKPGAVLKGERLIAGQEA